MRVGFEQADFDALAELWRECHPEKFWVTPALLKANTVGSPVFDWGASSIELGINGTPLGFVAIKKSASPKLWKGQDPDQAHVNSCAYREPQVGVDLYAYAKRTLRNRGIYRLVFGQDSRHFFPGCPSDCQGVRDFLIIEGFQEGGEVVDLERDMAAYEPPASIRFTTAVDGQSFGVSGKDGAEATVRPIEQADVAALRTFLASEFPGRWAHDTLDKIEAEGRSDFIYGLFWKGKVHGFALTQDWTHRLPIGGGVWHLELGEQWGSLGPIGVSQEVRGLGYGDALLGASLCGLRNRGARRSIIDWTGLVEFYGKHGFEVSRTYRSFVLRLDADLS